MTRALVTGAAGFIGSHLCERLVAEGTAVTGIDRLSDYYEPALKRDNLSGMLEGDGFEFVEGDLNELDLAELLGPVEVVYHLAGQPGVRPSWGQEFDVYLEDNVKATQRLLEAAADTRLSRLVYSSSSSIYGDAERYPTAEDDAPHPVSPYGVTKLAGEHLCGLYSKSFGVPVVSVRYFTIYGPRQRPDMAFARFIDAALDGRPIEVFGDGLQSRDFTYVDDAVEATVAAASAGEVGGTYNVAGGSQTTVLQVIQILEELVGGELSVNHLAAVAGDQRKTGADTARARRDLGYNAATSLEQGLARQLETQRAARAVNPS